MERQESAIEVIKKIASNERLPRFLLGVVLGNIVLLFFKSFMKKLRLFVFSMIPLAAGTLLSMIDFQVSDITSVLSHMFSIGYCYLFIRFVVLLSRKYMNKYLFDNSQYKQIVVMIAFVTSSITCYTLYTCNNTIDHNNLKFFISLAALNVFSLILTLILENGIISDFTSIMLFSISYGFSSSSKLKTFLSALRLIFVIISIVSPMISDISSDNDHNIVLFTMKKQVTRIIMIMTFLSYFILDPKSMFVEGSEISQIISLAGPLVYCLVIFYENYTYKNPYF